MMGLIFGTLAAVQTKFTTSAFAQSQNIICPTKDDVQHWDKIVFFIRTPDLASKVNLPANTELDIKVLDDPHKVADIKQEVLTFLEVPNEPKSAIQIVNVDYSIICNSPNSNTSQYSGSTTTAVPPNNPPPPCPNGQPQDANGNCPDTCPDGSPMPKGGVAECPHPPSPDTCPDGSPMPKGGVAECPHPPSPDTCPDGSPMPKGGVAECIPQPKSPPTHEAESLPTSDNCENQISANANVDICAEPGTMDAQDIEHNIGSGSNSGGGEPNIEHNIGERK